MRFSLPVVCGIERDQIACHTRAKQKIDRVKRTDEHFKYPGNLNFPCIHLQVIEPACSAAALLTHMWCDVRRVADSSLAAVGMLATLQRSFGQAGGTLFEHSDRICLYLRRLIYLKQF